MIRSMLRCCVWLSLALPSMAMAADPVWRGTLGTASVVVELDPQVASGRYFYTRHLRDIRLDGERSGTTLRMQEPIRDREVADAWVLDASTPGELRGEWIGANGRRLPIRLSRFDAATVRDPERAQLLREAPFEYLRIAALRLEPGWSQKTGDYELEWFEEPRTKVSLFQIASGYPAAQRQRVNRILREQHWKQISAAMGCVGESNGEYDLTTTLRRIDATVLSVSLFASYSCGGAHPDFGDGPLNIDPRTGEVLELEDVLWLGKGVPPRFEGATERAFFAYRNDVLGPWLAARMAKHHPGDIAPSDENECDYTEPEVWKYVSWHVRDDGLYLGPSFARAIRNCEYPDWSVLPWEDVKRHPGRVRIGPPSVKPAPAKH